jgi:hypothetical protein
MGRWQDGDSMRKNNREGRCMEGRLQEGRFMEGEYDGRGTGRNVHIKGGRTRKKIRMICLR